MLLKDDRLYYVGGIVRDEILNLPNFDTDYCYEGDAIKFAKNNNLSIKVINPDFGTVKVVINDKEIDIASTRTEIYPQKGHLPKVFNIGCSLKEDLIRRDFTINAMAKKTTNEQIIDYFGGLEDIKNKKIRVLHENSFIDDPTRIIRGLKFSIRFGFDLSDETQKLQEEYLDNVNYDMSYHRIRKELVETFNLNKFEAYDRFIEQRIYRLLGDNIDVPHVKGIDIFNAVKDIETPHIWLFYIFPFVFSGFDIEKIYPKKAERRIIEWVKKLKTQEPVNNTPKESIIMRGLLDNG